MSRIENYYGLISTSIAPEVRLPDRRPLTMTRNFTAVFALCVLSLLTVPLAVAWIASIFLT